MKAFHNDDKVKTKYIDRMKAHMAADELIRGTGFQDGRGCAVGCTLDKYEHKDYETELGIPEWLAHIEDSFFENMPEAGAMKWPLRFLESVNVGSDLRKIKAPFMIYILTQAIENFDHEKYPRVKTAIDTVIKLWETDPEWRDGAAWAAARSATEAAAESAAQSAADSAAEAAARAARSAESAAQAAAWSAAQSAAEAARAAADSAAWAATQSTRSAAYVKYSENLLELMRECH